MYRYFAVAYEPGCAHDLLRAREIVQRQLSACSDWQWACELPGLFVLHAGAVPNRWQCYSLPGSGVVLGLLFQRLQHGQFSARPESSLRSPEPDRIVQTDGRGLIEDYWGRYVGFIKGADGARYIVRDPTGALPCMYAHVSAVTLTFSHLQDLYPALSGNLTLDWSHVRSFLLLDRIVSRRTGFNEITNVLAGECLRVTAGGRTHIQYWNPRKFCAQAAYVDQVQAARQLRAVTNACVSGWSAAYGRVLLELSGGLDSSIVLSCLRRTLRDRQVTCLNLFSESAEGDERRLARKAASMYQCNLVERMFRSTDVTVEQLLRASVVSSPVLRVFGFDAATMCDDVASAHGAEATFSGQGGDHIFRQRVEPSALAELVKERGLRPELLRLASGIAHARSQPLWFVLRAAARLYWRPSSFDPFHGWEPPSFLNRDAFDGDLLSLLGHPWLDDEASMLPSAKRSHIFSLIDCQVFYTRQRESHDYVHPLISQPLMEYCLQLPTYVLTAGGIGRSLARTAFGGCLPPEVIARSMKGGATGYYHNILLDHLELVREILLEGTLVKEKLLDRGALAQALTEQRLIRGNELAALLSALRAELWIDQIRPVRNLAAA